MTMATDSAATESATPPDGYRCDWGIIRHRTTEQRVSLEWTAEVKRFLATELDPGIGYTQAGGRGGESVVERP